MDTKEDSPQFEARPKSGYGELFPAYDESEPVPQTLLDLVKASNEFGVPFPAEPNRKYANWWRSLHEIAHWAVKPPVYTATIFGGRVIPILQTSLSLDGTSPPSDVFYYKAGNDIIPDAELGRGIDPTPDEMEVQAWVCRYMERVSYRHPFADILAQAQSYQEVSSLGDGGWHKPATMRVWNPTVQFRPKTVRAMAYFNLDPLRGTFRADDKGFTFPFPNSSKFSEVMANKDALLIAYAGKNSLPLPVKSDEDRTIEALYQNTYSEWMMETRNGEFSDALRARLTSQFEVVCFYSSLRFEEMTAEIIAEAS